MTGFPDRLDRQDHLTQITPSKIPSYYSHFVLERFQTAPVIAQLRVYITHDDQRAVRIIIVAALMARDRQKLSRRKVQPTS